MRGARTCHSEHEKLEEFWGRELKMCAPPCVMVAITFMEALRPSPSGKKHTRALFSSGTE